MSGTPQVIIEQGRLTLRAGRGKHTVVYVWAGDRGPKAGHEEDEGWWCREWARRIQVAVSPAGRQVHINVDGVNITPELIERLKAEQEAKR